VCTRRVLAETFRMCESLLLLTCEWRACVCSAYTTTMEYCGECYNERMLQWTVFINKIRMLQWTRRNTIGRRRTRVCTTCRGFPLWLGRQSSSLLSFVRFSYQLSSVICLFAPSSVKIFFLIILLYYFSH